MYKLVISPKRTSAILYASHILDNRTVVLVVSDGYEEDTPYDLCLAAKKVQRQFELEKGYKVFGIRQLYAMNQQWYDIDYELVATKLQLLCAVTPFTHLYYQKNGDQRLYTICQMIRGPENKLVYSDKYQKGWEYTLNDEEIERKLDAIERFVLVRRNLLYSNQQIDKEWVQNG